MPINELEQHPCLGYYKNKKRDRPYYSLIIGGFPNEGSTDKLDANLNIISSEIDPEKVFMKFFYGSKGGVDKKNWEYLFKTFGEGDIFVKNNPEGRRVVAEDFLERNDLLMSDVIEITNRDGNSFFYKKGVNENLINAFKRNDDLKKIISVNPKIALYFTSKYDLEDENNIFHIFHKIFKGEMTIKETKKVENKVWALDIEIYERQIKVFFLPAVRGTTVDNAIVANYLIKHNNNLYMSVKSKTSKERTKSEAKELSKLYNDFRIEAYHQAFIKKNLNYDGSNPI